MLSHKYHLRGTWSFLIFICKTHLHLINKWKSAGKHLWKAWSPLWTGWRKPKRKIERWRNQCSVTVVYNWSKLGYSLALSLFLGKNWHNSVFVISYLKSHQFLVLGYGYHLPLFMIPAKQKMILLTILCSWHDAT